jgi:hypothetical protein
MKKKNITTITLEEAMKMKDRTRKDAPVGPALPDDFWKNAKMVYPEDPKEACITSSQNNKKPSPLHEKTAS